MPLSKDQEREIRQLLFATRYYLRLVARDCRHSTSTTMGATKDAFTGRRLTEAERRETIVNAHLGSAAVRLASIDMILWKAGCARFPTSLSGTFHLMFRHNVAHEEPDMSSPKIGEETYRGRQERIENTGARDAYAKLRKTTQEIEGFLKTHGFFHGTKLYFLFGPRRVRAPVVSCRILSGGSGTE